MKTFLIALKLFLFMTILTGIVYPLCITGLAQTFWKDKANGTLLEQNGKVIGSELIGQNFTSEKYFWSRPSAIDYNSAASSGSNLGSISADLQAKVEQRKLALMAAHLSEHAEGSRELPSDLLLASGSGLDPHISLQAAAYQLQRVADARHLSPEQEAQLKKLIHEVTEQRDFGILGEQRINVLKLNLAVDQHFHE